MEAVSEIIKRDRSHRPAGTLGARRPAQALSLLAWKQTQD